MTHTQWIGWLSSDPQKMNGFFWKAEQVGNLLSASIYFREAASRSPRRPVPFPITSKMDNGMTRYLRLFSIRKLSNYRSPSWAPRRPSTKSVGRGGRWMSCQKPYRIWLPNCSSSPWLSIINVIRYSLNKKNFTFFLEECQIPLNQAHCQINRIQREPSGQFTLFYLIQGLARRGPPSVQYFWVMQSREVVMRSWSERKNASPVLCS